MRPGWFLWLHRQASHRRHALVLAGYAGKLDWFWRFGRRVGISHEQLDRLQHVMHNMQPGFCFLPKLSMSLMIPSLIAAVVWSKPLAALVFRCFFLWAGKCSGLARWC